MAADERRAHERRPTDLQVRVELSGDRAFDGRAENIGEYGVFISTLDLEASLQAGDAVTLHFEYEGNPTVRTGSVVRLDQEFAAGEIRRSFAVKFDEPL